MDREGPLIDNGRGAGPAGYYFGAARVRQETVRRRRRLFIPKRKPIEISHVRKPVVAGERAYRLGGGGW